MHWCDEVVVLRRMKLRAGSCVACVVFARRRAQVARGTQCVSSCQHLATQRHQGPHPMGCGDPCHMRTKGRRKGDDDLNSVVLPRFPGKAHLKLERGERRNLHSGSTCEYCYLEGWLRLWN